MTNHPTPRRSRAEIVADAMLDVLLAATEKDAEAGLRSFAITSDEVTTLTDIARSQFGHGKRFAEQVASAIMESARVWNRDLEE